MNTSRIFLQRMAPSMLYRSTMMVSRPVAFSTKCAPAQKLREVFEQYRRENFDDEMPSRFRKQMVKAIEDPDHETFLVDNLNRILDNIGRHDAHLSNEELNTLLQDAGVPTDKRKMPVSKMMELCQ